MNNFQAWLLNKDRTLSEAISQEDLEKHGLDALKYAHSKVTEKRDAEKKEKMRKALEQITSTLASWVNVDENGSERLKVLAAVLHLQEPEAEWESDSVVGPLLLKSAIKSMTKMPDLEYMSKLFSHDNLVKHMSDPQSLSDLSSLLRLDYKRDILPVIRREAPEAAQDHGEIGKHFADFAVSHITAVAHEILKVLKGEEKEQEKSAEDEKPAPQPSQPPTPEPEGLAGKPQEMPKPPASQQLSAPMGA